MQCLETLPSYPWGWRNREGSCSEDTGAGTPEEEQQLLEMPPESGGFEMVVQ